MYISHFEKDFRTARCLNGAWDFQPVPVDRERLDEAGVPVLSAPAAEGWSDVKLIVPSPWNGNAWGGHTNQKDPATRYRCDGVYYPSYPEEWIHVQMGWLRRTFTLDAVPAGRVTLHFEAVAGEAVIYLNGHEVGTHFDNYLPFEVDVTAAIQPGENELLVGVRSHRLFDKQSETYKRMRCPYPTGSNTQGLCGIWQDVYLCTTAPLWVADVFVQPLVSEDTLKAEVTLENSGDTARTVTVGGTVCRWQSAEQALAFPAVSVTVPAGGKAVATLETKVQGRLDLWSPEDPNLYTAEIEVAGI
ncbi:MAG: beta-galactosidase, partial [Clostridia bacterium]|nr:beta-galactosidase [Clostridia bacterium]